MSTILTPGQKPVSFERPNLAFVEGSDDQAFLEAQLAALNIADTWQIHSMSGNKTNWTLTVGLALLDPWFAEHGLSISLFQDADRSAAATGQSLQTVFANNRLSVPQAHGQVDGRGRLRTGYFVLPDGEKNGALEDLLLVAAMEGRSKLAATYLTSIEDKFEVVRNRSKNTLQAYLAGQVEHVKTIPVAMKKAEVFPRAVTAFAEVRDFLSRIAEA